MSMNCAEILNASILRILPLINSYHAFIEEESCQLGLIQLGTVSLQALLSEHKEQEQTTDSFANPTKTRNSSFRIFQYKILPN